ncbi:MAG: hypothetical protein M3120_08265 [Pseudomonadota bacterium]|nr:hypothetical protein [Pseudomonadota bacterium]
MFHSVSPRLITYRSGALALTSITGTGFVDFACSGAAAYACVSVFSVGVAGCGAEMGVLAQLPANTDVATAVADSVARQ